MKIKSLIFSLFLLIGFQYAQAQTAGIQEHVPVTEQDMKAMQPDPAADSLAQVGNEIDVIIEKTIQRFKENPPSGLFDIAIFLIATLASLVGVLRKWWPFLKRQWSRYKGDTPVLVFSAVAAIVLSLVNGTFNVEAIFVQFAMTFTTAVVSYKLVLRAVWNWIGGVFKKDTDNANPVADA